MPQALNLHLISDGADATLSSIAGAIREQFTQVRTTDHLHPLVRDRQALDRVLKKVERAPGVVVYTLHNEGLAKVLEDSCKGLGVPCVSAPRPSATKTSRPSRSIRYVALGLLAVLLVWEILSRSAAAYLAEAYPRAAIHGWLAHPTALLNVAAEGFATREAIEEEGDRSNQAESLEKINDPKLDGEQETLAQDVDGGSNAKVESFGERDKPVPPSLAEIRTRLESALRKDPLNANAFELLFRVVAAQEDELQATQFARAAARRSLQETNAVYWMMRTSFEKGDYQSAMRYADALMRSRQEFTKEVMPILATIAEDKTSSRDLKQLLASDPPWRHQFLDQLPRYIKDARTPMNIFLALKDSPNPLTADDLRSYLNLLVGKGFYDVAYYTWLQFLPADQLSTIGLLVNGSFEITPTPSPFDWTFSETPGVIIKVENSPDKDGSRALLLDFGVGRVGDFSVSQLVMLSPGQYRFQGKYISEIVSKRGLQWRLACAGDLLGESTPVSQGLGGAVWEDFSFSFTVPATDCPAQRVELVFGARYESERFISGSIWYDQLKIVREPNAGL